MTHPALRHIYSILALLIFLLLALSSAELTENTYRHDVSYKDYGNCKWYDEEKQHVVPITIQLGGPHFEEDPFVDLYVNISQTRIYPVEGQEVPVYGNNRRVYSKTHYFRARLNDITRISSPSLTYGNVCDEIHVQVRLNDPRYHTIRQSKTENYGILFMDFSIRPKKLEDL